MPPLITIKPPRSYLSRIQIPLFITTIILITVLLAVKSIRFLKTYRIVAKNKYMLADMNKRIQYFLNNSTPFCKMPKDLLQVYEVHRLTASILDFYEDRKAISTSQIINSEEDVEQCLMNSENKQFLKDALKESIEEQDLSSKEFRKETDFLKQLIEDNKGTPLECPDSDVKLSKRNNKSTKSIIEFLRKSRKQTKRKKQEPSILETPLNKAQEDLQSRTEEHDAYMSYSTLKIEGIKLQINSSRHSKLDHIRSLSESCNTLFKAVKYDNPLPNLRMQIELLQDRVISSSGSERERVELQLSNAKLAEFIINESKYLIENEHPSIYSILYRSQQNNIKIY